YLPLRKSDERRFSQAGGRISQCLAAERRGKNIDVRRGEQPQALNARRRGMEKTTRKESATRNGIYAEVDTRRTQNNDEKQHGTHRRNLCAYLPLRKSDERRFSQAGGRISQCLAAERRGKNIDVRRGRNSQCLSAKRRGIDKNTINKKLGGSDFARRKNH